MKTLVLGGYGNFGARICRALGSFPAIDLWVGGRDARRAEAFAATIAGGARGVAIDLAAPGFAGDLR
ncbi:MAG: saccharopine dehydrogenase, partial [Variovorax sp.]